MPKTQVVIPCYNEARRLDCQAFQAFLDAGADVGFVFVDDGSSDETFDVLTTLSQGRAAVNVHRLARNSGKAEAVRQGMLQALELDPEFIGYWDADLATPLSAITSFVDILAGDRRLRLILGSRVALLGHSIDRRAARHYVSRVIATGAALTLGLPVYDTQCGAKMLTAARALALFEQPFGANWMFDVELLARIITQEEDHAQAGRYLRELPLLEWRDVRGSKVRPWDGITALWELFLIRQRYPALRTRTRSAPASREAVPGAAEKSPRGG